MYRNFYHLKCAPFAATAHPDPLFLSSAHQTALEQVLAGIDQHQGIVALLGAAGLGKTTLLRSVLIQNPQKQSKTIYLNCARLTSDNTISTRDLIQYLYQEIGYQEVTKNLADMINDIQKHFIADDKAGISTVIILDDAHCLSGELLTTLPQIISTFPYKEKFAQIILVGQPLLEKKLNHPKLQWFKHYLGTVSTLEPLKKKESRTYIKTKLRQAAATEGAIFDTRTITTIVKHAQGIPRNLNILCTDILLSGFQHNKRPVPTRIARQVIAEFENKPAYRPAHLRWLGAVAAVLLAGAAVPFTTGQLQTFSGAPTAMLQVAQPHLQYLASWNIFTKDEVETPVTVPADAPEPTPDTSPDAPEPPIPAVPADAPG
ncbi:MAG: AAA family ATPase, partial [Candidatus Tectomicrobia bacterium]|nr:AAA family ATPase [Candidatus Tectomicrobia bacterium]